MTQVFGVFGRSSEDIEERSSVLLSRREKNQYHSDGDGELFALAPKTLGAMEHCVTRHALRAVVPVATFAEMVDRSPPLSFRLPPPLVQRLDALAAELSAHARGARVSRAHALVCALERGLDAFDAEPPPASSASTSTPSEEPSDV